ncbi:hypothetical protein [Methylomonas rivi]|uniref:Lipocalin-like domain-containing protein n=1 Tax=Methylomonas rivi TaxID=2952226 RepID=A0ABT1U7H7_9GAMM|nr:hypothetical protein [Methylomonas sp. WSC-6]MCQ8129804.1 hypothetical protein [Methylomonas sp. WSC-6]
MKKINAAAMLLGLSLFMPAVYADVTLQSKDEVQGSWKLDHTKKNAASEEILKREDTWNFSGGKVTILHIPREGVFYDQPPVNYEVEDGKLKISLLGRPDKYDVYSLVEVNDKNMTLKGKFGDLYFFNKK